MGNGAGIDVYPAIDLRHGRCVRLQQGDTARETVYGDSPPAIARELLDGGAEWLHIVDLDAALGDGSHRSLIREIARTCGGRVQTGGGLRTMADLEEMLDDGVDRVVVGTAAAENPELVREAVQRWGPSRIAVGLDARGGRPAVRGWKDEADADLFTLATAMVAAGAKILIYTDIERDGMLTGPNLEVAAEVAARTGAEVIVSGGVGSAGDIRASAALGAGISGVIVGRALYEGRFDLKEALAAAKR